MKLNVLTATVCGFTVIVASAQTPSARPSFEAASIKLSSLNEGSDSDFTIGMVRMQATLKSMIRVAYQISADRIEGGPKWIDEDHYEINAKAEGPAQPEELREMLKTLLADRFGLQFHRVTKTASGYSLTVAGGGLKMTEAAPGPSHSTSGGRGTLNGKNVPISRLADRLSNLLASPVVDQTGNPNSFDFTLTWSPEKMNPSASAPTSDDAGPSLFTALQEQLGLKLESRKVPTEFLVVDQATRPTLN